MIYKLFDGNRIIGPRDEILGMVKRQAIKRMPQSIWERIEQKFANPQNWTATVKRVTTKSIADTDEITVEGAANAIDPDRGREQIVSSAWKMENFERNPIILFNHNHNWPIGSCTDFKIEDTGLWYKAVIGRPGMYPCLTDVQIQARSLLAQDILRASSVGFLPLNLEYDEENDILRYTEVELLEISIVSVPMQQGSLLTNVEPGAKHFKGGSGNMEITLKGSDAEAIVKALKSVEGLAKDVSKIMDALKALKDSVAALEEAINAEETTEGDDAAAKKEEEYKDEAKKLKAEIVKLKADVKTVTEEKDAVEKKAEELVDNLVKQGVLELPAQA